MNLFFERVSNRLTRHVAIRGAAMTSLYPVIEYPKCGGTWLCQMLSESLGVPFVQFSRVPVVVPGVVHGHWRFHPKLKNTSYLIRDGRDVMVSFYFHFTQKVTNPYQQNTSVHIDRLNRLLGADADLQDIRTHLPAFIEHIFAEPMGCAQNWREHTLAWMGQPNLRYVKYEDLRSDCVGAMKAHVHSLVGEKMDEERVERAVSMYSMKQMTGRDPGDEDTSSFIRKGIVGDWKNHFSREAAEVFDQLGGDALIKLGYEPDNSWVERCG